jgi:hypothetical protein
MAAFFFKSLRLVAGGLDKTPIFLAKMFPGCNAHDHVAGRRQWGLLSRHADGGSCLPAWHVRNDFQKINVFADESFGIGG